MKLANVANKSWWVPETRPISLAVQIKDPTEYHPAIRQKLMALISKAGSEAVPLAAEILADHGQEPMEEPERLVDQLLALVGVGEMVRAGDPEKAEPATQREAVAAVRAQAELTLADFLT
jgi:hypothetical protein